MAPPQHLFLKGVPEMKKTEFTKNRNMKDDESIAALAKLITECRDKAVKETLIKVKVLNTFEGNCSALKTADRNTLEETIKYLAANNVTFDSNTLNKEGLVLAILMEISRRLPYRCESCREVVTNDHVVTLVSKCKVCRIGACKSCHDGSQMYICPPCDVIVNDIKALPISMFKAKARPRGQSQVAQDHITQVIIGDDSDDEEEEELALGQGKVSQVPATEEVVIADQIEPEKEKEKTGEKETTPETTPESGFSIQNRKERKRVAKNASQSQSQGQNQSQKKNNCFFHTHGGCRHGLMGKTPALGVSECSRIHEPICKKFLNNGTGYGGCKNGDSCTDLHPRMCRESMKTRQCTKQKDEKRCPLGYHLRGTKMVENIVDKKKSNVSPKVIPKKATKVPFVPEDKTSDPNQGPNIASHSLDSLTSFLEVMIRSTLEKLLRPPPAAPPNPPVHKGLDLLEQLRGVLTL
jgi:hypothetical protein